MPHPIAIIQFPAGSEYDGKYKYNGETYLGHTKTQKKFRLNRAEQAILRNRGLVRFIKFSRAGSPGWGIMNHEEDLAEAADAYHRSQSERYKQAERQQSPNGEWHLSPRAFERFVGISATTRDTWHKQGVPILGGEMIETLDFPDGNGEQTPFYPERQAKRIVEARAAQRKRATVAQAANRCGVDERSVRRLAKDKKLELKAELQPERIGVRTVTKYRLSVKALRKELRRQKKRKEQKRKIEDPISLEEAGQLCGVHRATVGRWAQAGKIRCEDWGHDDRGGWRFVVSRSEVLAFATSLAEVRGSGDQAPWLRQRQIHAQYPHIPFDILRYYLRRFAKVPLPSLGHTILTRFANRPVGVKVRHKKIRQYWAEDVRRIAEWLAGREQNEQRVVLARGEAGPVAPGANDERAEGEDRPAIGSASECHYKQSLDRIEMIGQTILDELPDRTAEKVRQCLNKPATTTPKGDPGRPRTNGHFLDYFDAERKRYTKEEKSNTDIYRAYRTAYPEEPICKKRARATSLEDKKRYLAACRRAVADARDAAAEKV